MSFASVEYLPLVALVLAAYVAAPARARAPLLIGASWLFYLWVEPRDGVWLALSTVADFLIAPRIHAAAREVVRRRWLVVSLALNLGLLGTFKYSGFLLTSLGQLSSALGGPAFEFEGFALPLGISFYTFQTLSYTLDVYRRRQTPCTSFTQFALYVSFFPQLVAGPIERASHLLPQLATLSLPRAVDLAAAARWIVVGLAKKWILADRLFAQVWPVFSSPTERDSLTLAVSSIGMWVMLYLDFSAYTDLARGSARLFGIQLVANFDRPFLATSIQDWARRWHMSLGSWMFDYVWAPLSQGRATHARIWRANLIVMALFGLWHGANWTFVLWGLGYGALISCEHSVRLARVRRGARPPSSTPSAARTFLAWLASSAASVLFIALFFSPSLAFFGEFQARLWTAGLPASAEAWRWCAPLVALFAALLAVHAFGVQRGLETLWLRLPRPVGVLLLVLALAACVLLREGDARPFVYFEF
jgi:D-alanyl-lipoteichoic acid acyltransferase DltB (MBOAT superfamily)